MTDKPTKPDIIRPRRSEVAPSRPTLPDLPKGSHSHGWFTDEADVYCPSSGALRQFEAFVKEGSGSISVSA